jgi:protein-S-isoprenylcysteine O-methyltransferase Ste14
MDSLSDLVFRISFGVLWLFYFGLRLYFQRKIKGVGQYVLVNEKQEKFFFRLFALAYILLPLYFLTPWIDFAHILAPAGLRWAGVVITCIGIALFGWTHQVLGLNWTAVLALSEKQELVVSGPYHYVRHPMYAAFFIIGFGFLFLSANWLVGILYIGTLSLMYFTRVSAEEKMMMDRFGDRYREYMQNTGRILPRLTK